MNFLKEYNIQIRSKEFGNPIHFVFKNNFIYTFEEKYIDNGIISYCIIGNKRFNINDLINNINKTLYKNKLGFLLNKNNKKNTLLNINKIFNNYTQEHELARIITNFVK